MKKLILTLSLVIAYYFSYAQNTFPGIGNVGIGTTSPGAGLDITNVANGGYNFRVTGGYANFNSSMLRFTYGSSSHLWDVNFADLTSFNYHDGSAWSLNRITFDNLGNFSTAGNLTVSGTNSSSIAGNVGIGTTSPGAPLHVYGTHPSNTKTMQIGAGTSASSMFYKADGLDVIDGPLYLQGNYNQNVLIGIGGGNVGIGTTIPRDRLDLSTNRGNNLLIGDRVSIGSMISSAATVIGQNVKADNTTNQMSYVNTTPDGASAIKMQYDEGITFHTNYSGGNAGEAFSSERFRITPQGNVAIGTTNSQGYRLAVNGSAIVESVTVKSYGTWPDYVFKPDYYLPSLTELKSYIDKNQHLPDMPSEQEVKEKGINLGELVKIQTKKIEELTLYLIEKENQLAAQHRRNEKQDARIAALETALLKLTANK